MFSKHSEVPTSFASTWKTEQLLETGSTQTDDIVKKEEECQVIEQVEVGIQTEEEEPKNYQRSEYDEASLSAFLKRVTPKVIRELERQNRSQAFHGYSVVKEEESLGVKMLHSLRWNQLDPEGVVTGIDWSCTGSVIGVSYGSSYHDDWCDHKGAVAVWNINRSDFDANQPERVIEASSCVLSLAFHPTNPAVFAAGTFSGEILVYNLSHTEDVTPLATGDCGGGSVTSLSWVDISVGGIMASRTPNTLIATTSSGFVLVWGLNLTKQQLPLKSGYMLQGQDIPRGIRTHMDGSSGVGISSASFNTEDSMLFVLGAEGGGLFLCSTSSEVPTGVEFGGVGLMRCVTSTLASHSGRVITAQFSPHHRNAVLSAASDNQIRLFTLLQPNKPVSVIHSEEAIACVRWSPSRPLVVAVGRVTGEAALYDFGKSSGQPFLILPAAEKPSPITTLQFNKKNMKLVAVGDQLGRVCVWHLPNSAVSPLSTELSNLHTILDTLAD
ncbi:cytoplasmic dynein 2 intermediate chain 2-like [Homarus americanus]|uniref:cytoplasmic dynein 2 intermediate chain 2-like n=1 Tax=Homarus americanus TaxID=6706 RepID=UPI001C45DED3|nr:cytoplasmic dynein 2 intermediate chain 2-like [Homarus americanus]